jgi:NTE family protein
LGDIGAASFDRTAEAIPIGEQAARALANRLINLTRPRTARPPLVSQAAKLADEAVTIDFIRIINKSGLSDSLIAVRLRQKPGDVLDIDKLEQDIAKIYGLDYFETVEYQVVIENGKTGIVVTATERATGLDSFRFGLNLETDFEGDSDFNISVRYQAEGLNDLGGELLLQGIAGEKLGATVQFLQPLDPATRYFINAGLSFLARDVFTFENGSRVAEFRVNEAIANLSASRQLGTWGAISVGLNYGYGWRDVNVGPSTLPDDDYGIGSFFASFNYDTFDQLDFPKSGAKGKAVFRRATKAIGGEDDFNKVTANFTTAHTWDRNTVLVGGRAGFIFDGDGSVQDLFALGGLFNLSGFQSDELTGQNLAAGGLIYYRNIGAQEGLLKFPIYLGASLEVGNVWENRSDMDLDDVIVAGSGFVGVDTPLGPFYLAYGHAEGGNDAVYFFLGQTF